VISACGSGPYFDHRFRYLVSINLCFDKEERRVTYSWAEEITNTTQVLIVIIAANKTNWSAEMDGQYE